MQQEHSLTQTNNSILLQLDKSTVELSTAVVHGIPTSKMPDGSKKKFLTGLRMENPQVVNSSVVNL